MQRESGHKWAVLPLAQQISLKPDRLPGKAPHRNTTKNRKERHG